MTPDGDRFLTKVAVADVGCWYWTASLTRSGYGLFRVGSTTEGTRRLVSAHRYAYEALVGPIPDGLVIDHLCRNRACVRPDHLEPVTHGENLRRGVWPNAAKTHCPQGHPYDEANTYVGANGWRLCRACGALRARDRRRRP